MQKGLSAALAIVGVFLSFVVTIECLDRGATTWFGGDEYTDLTSTLPAAPKTQLLEKAVNQTGSAPVHFAIQHLTVKHLLRNERDQGFGWDWHVSLRYWPSIAVGLGCLVAFLLLSQESLGLALALPVLMANQSYVTFYGAQNRIYGAWIGFSAAFYALSIAYALRPEKKSLGLAWIFAACGLTGVAVTAPAQIFSIAAVLVLCLALTRRPLRTVAPFLAVGCVLSVTLMSYWNVQNKALALANAKEPLAYYVKHYWTWALAPFGGPKGAGRLLLMSLAMIFYWSRRPRERRRQLYLVLGTVCLSQALITIPIYALQILKGYFFADRHVIFATVLRALSGGAFAVLCFDVLSARLFKRFSSKRARQRVVAATALALSLAVCFDWLHWSLVALPSKLTHLASFRRPYCHGPVAYTAPAGLQEIDRLTRGLDALTEKRHAGQCERQAVAGATIDFSPAWIYGTADSR